jgi:hypothetical protein
MVTEAFTAIGKIFIKTSHYCSGVTDVAKRENYLTYSQYEPFFYTINTLFEYFILSVKI